MMAALEILRAHAPIAVMAFLFGGAALALASPHGRTSWVLGLLAALGACLIAADIGLRVLAGDHDAGAERLFSLDGVGAFAAPFVLALVAAAVLAEGATLASQPKRAQSHVIALHLAAGGAWVGALWARDIVAVIICVNAGWLAVAALTALSPARGALNGALRMLFSGGAAAAFMLLGAGLIGYAVGDGAVSAVANAVIAAPVMALLGFVMLLAPLMLIAGAAPLHHWSGPAYGASNAGLALTIASIAALVLIVRLAAVAATAPALAEGVQMALASVGVASVLIGSLQAVGAINVRRLVAYAGAAQAGCVLVAIALESPAGLAAALVQVVAWGAGAFALLAGMSVSRDAALTALDGLGRRAPLAGVAITVGALSFMGAPLTLGFLGRWRLIEAGVGAGWWWATGAAIITSLAAVFYGGRLIERLYFRRASETSALDPQLWRLARAPVMAAAVVLIAFGLAPGWLLDLAARAAALALGLVA